MIVASLYRLSVCPCTVHPGKRTYTVLRRRLVVPVFVVLGREERDLGSLDEAVHEVREIDRR